MLSTGDFLAALKTGMKVAIAETNSEIRRVMPTFNTLKFKSAAVGIIVDSVTELLIALHKMPAPIEERTKQIIANMNASEKNILNTSAPLAPTALKMPISFVFAAIDAEMKFKSKRAANPPRINPTTRKTVDKALISSIISCMPENTSLSIERTTPLSGSPFKI